MSSILAPNICLDCIRGVHPGLKHNTLMGKPCQCSDCNPKSLTDNATDAAIKMIQPAKIHIAGNVNQVVQYCGRCRAIIVDYRNVSLPENDQVLRYFEPGKVIVESLIGPKSFNIHQGVTLPGEQFCSESDRIANIGMELEDIVLSILRENAPEIASYLGITFDKTARAAIVKGMEGPLIKFKDDKNNELVIHFLILVMQTASPETVQ